MFETNNENSKISSEERGQRRDILASLLALTGGSSNEADLLEAYIDITAKVPMELLCRTSAILIETWTSDVNYHAPRPADILAEARRIRSTERREAREREERAYLGQITGKHRLGDGAEKRTGEVVSLSEAIDRMGGNDH